MGAWRWKGGLSRVKYVTQGEAAARSDDVNARTKEVHFEDGALFIPSIIQSRMTVPLAVEKLRSDKGLQKNVDGSFIAVLSSILNQLLDQIDDYL